MSSQDKMQKFTDAVMADAQSERQKILNELEKEKVCILAQSEEDMLKEFYHMIQSEVARIKNVAGKELSMRNLEIRKELLSRRAELTNNLFDKIKERISKFCESDEYSAKLKNLISTNVNDLGEEDTAIMANKNDVEQVNKLLQDLNLHCAVSENKNIKLGGLYFANEKKGILIDESFDSKFNEQLRWFEENSGLIIT